MNTSTNKGIETRNAEVQNERKVEAVDYRSSAGHGQEQRPVQVTHQPHSAPAAAAATPAPNKATSGGVLQSAAAAVSTTLDSAKEVISGK